MLRLLYVFSVFRCSRSLSTNKRINLTPRQQKYVDYLNSPSYDLVIAKGPAGTGKTWLACKTAAEMLQKKQIDKIIITRPTTTVENENIGFLPGNIDEKYLPFTQPLFDCFTKQMSKSDLNMLLKQGKIEICPLGFMRGRTFDNSYVIADEMQNALPSQTKMLLTRIGYESKLILTGDISQCDLLLDEYQIDGISDLTQKIKYYYKDDYNIFKNNIAIIDFQESDCKRSPFVSKVLDIYS